MDALTTTIIERGDLAHLALFLWASGFECAAGVGLEGNGFKVNQRFNDFVTRDCRAESDCSARGTTAHGGQAEAGKTAVADVPAICLEPGGHAGRQGEARGASRGQGGTQALMSGANSRRRGWALCRLCERLQPNSTAAATSCCRGLSRKASAKRAGASGCCSSTTPRSRWASGRACARTRMGSSRRGKLVPGVPRADALKRLIEAGALDGLSIGFRTVKASRRRRQPAAATRSTSTKSRS
jgi:hypothetical protein